MEAGSTNKETEMGKQDAAVWHFITPVRLLDSGVTQDTTCKCCPLAEVIHYVKLPTRVWWLRTVPWSLWAHPRSPDSLGDATPILAFSLPSMASASSTL